MEAISLKEATEVIAGYLDLDAAALLDYTTEDPYPRLGWDAGKGDAPLGSLWSVEGRVLYALVRSLEPISLMELGGLHGASATHIAAALEANKLGKLTSVDNGYQTNVHGDLIPEALRKYVTLIADDGIEALRKRKKVDFIYEDMMHSRAQSAAVGILARDKLPPGGVLVSHDAAHYIVGRDVLAGYEDAGIAPLVVLIEPSDCGLAIWKKGK